MPLPSGRLRSTSATCGFLRSSIARPSAPRSARPTTSIPSSCNMAESARRIGGWSSMRTQEMGLASMHQPSPETSSNGTRSSACGNPPFGGWLLDQRLAKGIGHGLRPRIGLELVHRLLDVRPHRERCEPEVGPDLLVPHAVGKETEHLSLALRDAG